MPSESGRACNLCRCAACRTRCPSMNRTSVHLQICLATALAASFVSPDAKGDGGIIRLQQTQGPFSVTVFSSPEAVAGGVAGLSALIQERETGKVGFDGNVSFSLTPPDGSVLDEP